MSYGSTILTPCPNIQDELTNYFLTCEASRLREPAPFFDFITSPINNSGLSQRVHPGGGKVKTVELRYDQRINEDNVDENITNPTCTAETKRGDSVAEYTIDPDENLRIEEKIDLADWANICRSNPEVYAAKIQRLIDALVRRVATKTTEQAVALTGKWDVKVDNVVADKLQVRTLRSGTTDEVYPFTMEDIDLATEQTGYCGPQFIAGGTLLYKSYRRHLAGCCAAQGVNIGDLMNLYGKAVAYDRRVAAALGGNDHSFIVQPGALALLEFTKNSAYEGLDELMRGANYYAQVIQDPASGLSMDFITANNCGQIHLLLFATTKLVALPNDIFGTGDDKAGVKFFNVIKVVNS